MIAMMAEDKALRYQAVLLEVENKIQNLEAIGLNMQRIRKEVEEIKIEFDAKHRNNIKNNNGKTMNAFLPEIYNTAISKIESIINDLDNHRKEYYIYAKKINLLKHKLEKIDEIDVMNLLNETSNLLSNIEFSSTIDYEEEEKIVEAIYEVVYNVMKIASIYDVEGQESLFYKVASNKTHSAFISSLIKDEIALCDNPTLLEKQMNLEATSFDDNALIDRELFALLAISSNDKYIANLKNKLQVLFDKYKEEMENISNNIKALEDETKNYKDYKHAANKDLKRIVKRGSIIGALLVMLGTVTYKTYNYVEKTNRTYYTKTTTYDDTEVTYDEDYEEKRSKEIKIIKKSPWEQTIFGNYKRIYNYYYLDLEQDINDPEYYIDLTSSLKPESRGTEKIKGQPEDFDSDESHYIVEIKEYGDDYKKGDVSESLFAAITILLASSLIPINVLIKTKFLNILKRDINDYKHEKSLQNNYKKKMEKYSQIIRELFNNAKGLLATIRNYPGYRLIAQDIEEYINEFAQREEIQSLLKDNEDYKKDFGGKSI